MPLKDKAAYNTYMASYMLRRYHKRRAIAFFVLSRRQGGRWCAECGSRAGLEIDHVDWRTKTAQSRHWWNWPFTKFLSELQHCQILCSYHHKIKSDRDLSEMRAGA